MRLEPIQGARQYCKIFLFTISENEGDENGSENWGDENCSENRGDENGSENRGDENIAEQKRQHYLIFEFISDNEVQKATLTLLSETRCLGC